MGRVKRISLMVGSFLSLALLMQAPYAMSKPAELTKVPDTVSETVKNITATSPNAFGLPDFTQLVEANSPVVVNISTTRKVVNNRARSPHQFDGLPEELLRHFFGIPGFNQEDRGGRNENDRRGNRGAPQEQPEQRSHSLGSGFIISTDGYILTNNHVIDGADEVVVRMRNRQELKAKVIGADARTDVALIKIEADDLPVAKIGRSNTLKPGQWVVAIGEPFGLDYTVTHGIVSAVGRALPEDTYVPFIQTDVSINPGNSGGPLFNLNGEVVGVNSQIYSKSGGSMGLSFSIPIDIAMNVAEQLMDKGTVSRGFLGVQVQEVTSDLSKSFGLKVPTGALVGQTYPDTPADRAGIQAGDIILEFNGQTIFKSSDLPPLVGVTKVDTPVNVKLLRQGKEVVVKVKLSDLDKSDAQTANLQNGTSDDNRLGATFEALSKDELDALNLPFGVKVITTTEGAARKAGIRSGDILVTIDFQPVKNVKALQKIIKDAPEERSLPVRVVRDKRSMFIPLILGK